jgi:hypothetical protein
MMIAIMMVPAVLFSLLLATAVLTSLWSRSPARRRRAMAMARLLVGTAALGHPDSTRQPIDASNPAVTSRDNDPLVPPSLY